MSFFNDLFGQTGRSAALQAMQAQERRAAEIHRANQAAIDTGMGKASGYLNQAGDIYKPMSAMGSQWANQGGSAWGDAVGANGADGNARAVANFQAGPGFNYARDQALEGTTRRMNSLGMLGGGNTLTALQTQGTELANQGWNQYVNQLGQYDMAGRQTGLAALGQGNAGQAQSLNNLASLEQYGIGAKTGNNNQSIQNFNVANGYGLQGAQAASQGAANAAGLGMQLANLAMGGLGGMGGGGFNLGNIGAGFGNLASGRGWNAIDPGQMAYTRY